MFVKKLLIKLKENINKCVQRKRQVLARNYDEYEEERSLGTSNESMMRVAKKVYDGKVSGKKGREGETSTDTEIQYQRHWGKVT